ncbi:MAG: plasmid replication protein RepC [Steroidobacteraceae bacterium]
MPELPHSEVPCPAPIRAHGTRRITLEMRARLDQADRFTGLPHGTAKPFTFLAAFQEAEPYLGLPRDAYKLVSWLVQMTRPPDWEEGSRPIAWPSARREAEFLGLSPARVKALNRAVFEAGIFVIRDNPQGRRYGRRDAQGRIVEAYGFDLSPLALRYTEFVKIAAEAAAERARMGNLRRRCTLARKGIAQAVDELGVQGEDPAALDRLIRETAELVKAAKGCTRSDELALAAKALERRRDEAEALLRQLVKPVDWSPMGVGNEPHSTATTLKDNDINHTVTASKDSSPAETSPQDPSGSSKQHGRPPEALQITPAVLVELAPRLAPYVSSQPVDVTWSAVVEAALWLSGEMGISRTLWAHACQLMGRDYAAIALAVVSTKAPGHFTSNPGGYFGGMVKRFEAGELHLARTLWKLKQEKWGDERRRRMARE